MTNDVVYENTEMEALSDFQTTVDHEKSQFIRCNTIGHAWFDVPADWSAEFGIPVTLRCERCGTERRESFNRYGDLLTRHYVHPDGYKYAKGSRPTRAEFRIMMVMQQITESKKNRKG